MAQKTVPTPIDPRAYVAALDNAARRADAETLMAMLARVTGAEPRMWGPTIIGYGQYHYKYASGHEGDSFLAGFAPRKRESVVYLIGEIPGQAELLAKLGKHRMGKACLYLTSLQNIDLGVLETLVRKSVAATTARYPG